MFLDFTYLEPHCITVLESFFSNLLLTKHHIPEILPCYLSLMFTALEYFVMLIYSNLYAHSLDAHFCCFHALICKKYFHNIVHVHSHTFVQ